MDKQIFGFNAEIKGVNEGERSVTALVSTGAQDRMGEVLDPKGADLKNFRKNPVVLLGHNYSQPPVGRAMWIKKAAQGILSKVQFATTQLAEDVFQLYKGGFMKAFSVGFIPKEWVDGDGKKDPRRTYTKWELIEFSAVPVPANPEALVLAIQKGDVKISDVLQKEMLGGASIHHEPEPEPDPEPVIAATSPSDDGADVRDPGVLEHLEMLEAEIEQITKKYEDSISSLTKENNDLKYKLYQLLAMPKKGTVAEMADEDIAKKIGEALDGAIRRITGKVS